MTLGRIRLRILTSALLTSCIVIGSIGLARQARDIPTPQRPDLTGAALGRARIAGRVVDAQAIQQPVRRAIVMLTGSDLPGGRSAITDSDGRFSFDRLPAGRFTLTALKPAYLRSAYGAIKPGGTGTPITLDAGRQITGLVMTLAHGGAIAGTLRDERGAPVVDIEMTLTRINVPAAPAEAGSSVPILTDNRGEYRAYGLFPGTYSVSAASRLSRGIGEVGVMSTTEVDATFARLRQGTATIGLPHDNVLSYIVRPEKAYSTAPIFYPGVAALGEAAPITLALGEELSGVDFVFRLARSASVRGTINGFESGQMSNLDVSLGSDAPYAVPSGFGSGPSLQQRPTGNDGRFAFTNVTPGKTNINGDF